MEDDYRDRLSQLRRQFSPQPSFSSATQAAKSIIDNFLQVETQAASVRPQPRAPRAPVLSPIEEDIAIAMDLYSQYQAEKRKVVQPTSETIAKKPVSEYDPRINIEERHDAVRQKREERKAKQELIPKTPVVEGKAGDKGDLRLQELRAQRAALEAETQPEILEEMRQRVKQEREELQAMDLQKKEHDRRIKEIESVAKQRERLAKEREESERQILLLKRQRIGRVFEDVLGHYLFQSKAVGFRRLDWYRVYICDREIRVMRKDRFRRLSAVFRVWVAGTIEEKTIRAAEEQRKAEEAEAVRMDTADRHYYWRTFRTCWKLWITFVEESKRQREEDRKAEKRQQKIATLFQQMEQRRRDALYREIPQITQQDEAVFTESERAVSEVGTQAAVEPSVQTDSVDESVETVPVEVVVTATQSQAPIVSPAPPSSVSPAPPSSASPAPGSVKKQTKASKQVLLMQQREEERKLKREQLQQKYRDKEERERQLKLEAEQKALEDEARKKREIGEKRRQEAAKKREMEEKKREESQRLEQLSSMAVAQHRRGMLKYSLFLPWQKAVHRAWKLEELCIAKGDAAVQRTMLLWWKAALEESKRMKKEQHRRKQTQADEQYRFNLRKGLVSVLRLNVALERESTEAVAQTRADYLRRHVFLAWTSLIVALQTENDLRRASESRTIRAFHLVCFTQRLIGPAVLENWKEAVAEAKDEKFKAQHAAEMWSKVQQWLASDSEL